MVAGKDMIPAPTMVVDRLKTPPANEALLNSPNPPSSSFLLGNNGAFFSTTLLFLPPTTISGVEFSIVILQGIQSIQILQGKKKSNLFFSFFNQSIRKKQIFEIKTTTRVHKIQTLRSKNRRKREKKDETNLKINKKTSKMEPFPFGLSN